jgi:PilZ domain
MATILGGFRWHSGFLCVADKDLAGASRAHCGAGPLMTDLLASELEFICAGPPVGKRRHPCKRQVVLWAAAGPPEVNWQAETCNISQGGVGLHCDRPFDTGLLLLLRVENPTPRPAWRLVGRVIHATPRGPGLWLVGCQLTNILSATELEAILEEG